METDVPPLTKKLFAINTCCQKSMFSIGVNGYINHTPRQAPGPGVADQHKINFMLVDPL